MKLKNIYIKNFGPFKNKEIELSDGINAFVGQLGSGKTMALEAAYATAFLEFATRPRRLQAYSRLNGELTTIWLDKNDKIELKVQLEPDSLTPKIKINDIETKFATQAQYLEFTKNFFYNKEFWLATILCAQTKAGSFVELAKTPRKEIFYQLLNLSKYNKINEKAGLIRRDKENKKNELEGKLSLITSQINEFEKEIVNFQDLQKEVFEKQARMNELEVLTKDYKEYHLLKSSIIKISKEIENISNNLKNKTPFDISEKTNELKKLNLKLEQLNFEVNTYKELTAVMNNIEIQAKKIIAMYPGIKEFNGNDIELDELRKSFSNKLTKISKLKYDIEFATSELSKKKNYVPPCGDSFPDCELKKDLVNVSKLQEIIKQKPELEKLESEKLELEYKIKNYSDMLSNSKTLMSLRESFKETKNRLTLQAIKNEKEFVNKKAELEVLKSKIDKISSEIKEASEYQKLSSNLKLLTSQKVELELKISGISYDEKLEEEYNSLVPVLKSLNEKLIKLTEKFEMMKSLKEQKIVLETELNITKTDLSEFEIIESMTGPNGIPAIEIDNIIPEIETLSTSLLKDSGWGYQIRLETQKTGTQKEEGKLKILDTMDLLVFDESDGILKSVEDLSVGQRSVISEAISLALAIKAKQLGIIQIETLFRDETTANLNKEAAKNYVNMLKEAMDLGGWKNMIYVTHQEFLLSQVDNIITF